jgi:hypothetical protein
MSEYKNGESEEMNGSMEEYDDGVKYETRPDLNVKLDVYPNVERQEASNRKYMTYDSVQTGAPGKAAPLQ